MATRARVRAMLDAGVPVEEVGRRLGISAGLVYMIATGRPADGSDTVVPEERTPYDVGASQRFANPLQAENPTTKGHVLEWIKQRAASDPQAARAAARQTLDPGEPRSGGDGVVNELTRQHDQIAALLKRLGTIPAVTKGGNEAHQQQRKAVVDLITDRVSRHEAAEEQQLWPMIREQLPDGAAEADKAAEQEQQLAETLDRLAPLSGGDEEFDDHVETLQLQWRKHVTHEEKVFLQLRMMVGDQAREQAGKRVDRARKTAAPRPPRPRAPRKSAGTSTQDSAPAVDRLRSGGTRKPTKRQADEGER